MHQADYRLIASSELRNVIRSVVADPRDLPTRSQLRAQLVEACPPGTEDKVIDALMTKCAEFAQAAADPGARWDLRAEADALCLHVLKSYEASERLIPSDEDTAVDVKAALDAIDGWNPVERRLSMADHAARQTADIESAKRLAGQS